MVYKRYYNENNIRYNNSESDIIVILDNMYGRLVNQEKKIDELNQEIKELKSNPPSTQESIVEQIWDNKEDEFWDTF